MAKRSQQLTLEVGLDAAIEICTRALLGLGWEVSRDGKRLTANESAAELGCHVWPVEVGVGVDPEAARSTRVELDFSTAGAGPIQGRQLRDRMRAVCIAVQRELENAGVRSP